VGAKSGVRLLGLGDAKPSKQVSSELADKHGMPRYTSMSLIVELQSNRVCLVSLSHRFWRVQFVGQFDWKRPTAIKGIMNYAKTRFTTEILAGAIVARLQYVPLLQCVS
jgi:hypothetical protein